MKRSLLTALLILTATSFVFSQSYLAKNRTLQFSESDMIDLSNGQTDPQKLAPFFFNKSLPDLQKLAQSKNLNPEVEEGTFYIEDKRLRMDANMMGEKGSFIVNLETRIAYNILYSQKTYIEMNLDELKEMKEQMTQNIASQMQNMQGMMENMPPEAKAAMQEMYGSKEKTAPDIKATGKTKTINGFPCKEYLISGNTEQEQAWVTSKYPKVKAAFFEIFNAMPADEEESNKWEQADGWPVQTSSIKAKQGYVEGSFLISEIYSIEEVTHKPGTFDPPQGFKKRTMQDMMMPGMNRN